MTTKKRVRSPNYPSINLENAITRARELYEAEHTHPATADVASRHWGYKSAAAGGALIVAALRSFGLADTAGSKNERTVRVSELGKRILLDQRLGSQEREGHLRECALKPTVHAELWEKWGSSLPSDENVRYHLTAKKGFNERTVEDFMAQYKATLAFARVAEDDTLATDESDNGDGPPDFSTGSSSEDSLVRPAPMLPSPTSGRPTMKQDTYTLDEGDVVLQWPARLSQESYEDLKDWLDLIARKMKRAVPTDVGGETESE